MSRKSKSIEGLKFPQPIFVKIKFSSHIEKLAESHPYGAFLSDFVSILWYEFRRTTT